MIGVIVPYSRGARDMRALDAHVWKATGQVPRLIECANVVAADSLAALRVMLQMRDGAPRARIAAWHIVVSPRVAVTEGEGAAQIINAVVKEFGAAQHPRLTWLHAEKQRHKTGGAPTHIHLVLGHVGPTLKALDMRHAERRLERVMRVLEFTFGEELTCGQHHTAVVSALRRDDRDDVADRLIAAHGTHPDRPRARMTAGMRAAAARAGFELAELVAAIERRWEEAPPGAGRGPAFLAALNDLHVRAEPGRVPGAVALYRGSTFVGALHRLIGADAAIVAAQITRNRGDYDGRQTGFTAGIAEAKRTGAQRHVGRRLAAGGDARSGNQGGVDLRGDPDDPRERGGERRHGGRDDDGPRAGRAGEDPAAHRGQPEARRRAFGHGVLLLIARALREDPSARILPEARLLTRAGRIAEGECLAARLGALLLQTRAPDAEDRPPLPDSYTAARAALAQAEEAVRYTARRRAFSEAIDVPVAQRKGVLGRIVPHRHAAIEHATVESEAVQLREAREREHRQALRARDRAVAAVSRILTVHARNTAAAEARQAVLRARRARRQATLEGALQLLGTDDLWAARGVKAILREVADRRLAAEQTPHAGSETEMSPGAAAPIPTRM